VDRDILELRAQIDRGDSGGPLILQDGTIGGLDIRRSALGSRGRLRADADVGSGADRPGHRPA
jgi:hypothetical protein